MENQQDVDKDLLSGHIAVIGSLTDDPGRQLIAGSTPSPCAECRRDVMLSPTTRRLMSDRSVVLCVDCAVIIAESRGEAWIDPGRNDEQLREMAANRIEPKRWCGATPTNPTEEEKQR